MPVYCENRRARFDFYLEESFEAGLILMGSEVKAIREKRMNIAESYVGVQDGELVLINSHIGEWLSANIEKHEPRRPRKLLLKKKEIKKLIAAVQRDGMTIVPTKVYTSNGKIKLEVCLAKGKKNWDKKQTIKERDIKKDTNRYLKGDG